MELELLLMALVIIERLISLIKAITKLIKALKQKDKRKPDTRNSRRRHR